MTAKITDLRDGRPCSWANSYFEEMRNINVGYLSNILRKSASTQQYILLALKLLQRKQARSLGYLVNCK